MSVVTVIGKGRDCPEDVARLAYDVGYLLGGSDLRLTLVHGGLGGAMSAVALGFLDVCELRGAASTCIGLRPGQRWGTAIIDGTPVADDDYPGLLLYTGLPEAVRNVVTASCAEVVVMVPGSHGTVQEAVTALDLGTPVVAMVDLYGRMSEADSMLSQSLHHLCVKADRNSLIDVVTALLVG